MNLSTIYISFLLYDFRFSKRYAMGSEEEDVSEEEIELRDFTIVQFIKRGRQAQARSVDVVPSKWLDSQIKGRLCVRYPILSTPEDIELLRDFVKSCADPPDLWKTYTVRVLGQASMDIEYLIIFYLFLLYIFMLFCYAGTYKEAEKKLKVLETENNAFTESDADPESKTKKVEQAVKKQSLQQQMLNLKTQHTARIKSQLAPTHQTPLETSLSSSSPVPISTAKASNGRSQENNVVRKQDASQLSAEDEEMPESPFSHPGNFYTTFTLL